ncbi:MAG: AtpZ/AtpI family protein [Candidatus Nitrospinota bacterium M3_3B_026]
MNKAPREDEDEDDRRALSEKLARKVERRLKARGERDRSVWFGLGMFGLVGWSVAIPTLIGVAAGLWLDKNWPSGKVSWTLTLLVIGVAVGCWNAWYWVKQESGEE